ncbi:hypothetical protein SAMN04489732_1594 [Amycolatopsis saalfeldensis]|uniref:Uncharacterized protein n=1 Tax=Amycolatopsis saalfeldensis TaxID=394193 RepID=A0A1H8YRA0_9PSEU|nr:hypothetical protein SAMN04489732_1594 [Amycolatopsis saalfeldensis]
MAYTEIMTGPSTPLQRIALQHHPVPPRTASAQDPALQQRPASLLCTAPPPHPALPQHPAPRPRTAPPPCTAHPPRTAPPQHPAAPPRKTTAQPLRRARHLHKTQQRRHAQNLRSAPHFPQPPSPSTAPGTFKTPSRAATHCTYAVHGASATHGTFTTPSPAATRGAFRAPSTSATPVSSATARHFRNARLCAGLLGCPRVQVTPLATRCPGGPETNPHPAGQRPQPERAGTREPATENRAIRKPSTGDRGGLPRFEPVRFRPAFRCGHQWHCRGAVQGLADDVCVAGVAGGLLDQV